MGGNLWTLQDIDILKQNINNQKKIEFAILKTNNLNKGMTSAINFCKKNKINFHYLESKPYGEFIEILSKVENLIFFPQWLESYNRLSIEARILGCKLITNNLIGAASEDYFRLKNKDLLKKIEENNITIVNRWKKMIDEDQISFIDKIKNFKISVFCPIYNAQKYIKNFLDDMVSQTFFEKSEIIIIDANSPQNEFDTISKYMEKYSNIVYKRLDYRASVMETENMAIKMAKGDFIAQCCVDDRHSIEYLEIMSKHLIFDESVDLVYSDCFQTNKDNETFALNSSGGLLYEHSKKSFSKHNMIKCLPGPMPMWRKSIHEKVGFFKEEMRYAGDWEFFLRMVDMGCKFKKIDVPLGLYYFNADGLSTSEKYQKERGKEEADVFFKYKHVFGEANYKKYVNYFSQFRS
jgi:glycosyltransferase involved in cell wall biosynthesis